MSNGRGLLVATMGSRIREENEENMERKKNHGLYKIQGLIIPAAWDKKGNVLAVAVSTFDEEEYFVEKGGKGDELLGLLRKEMEVSGIVGIRDGDKTIKVKKVALIKESEVIDEALNNQREGNESAPWK
jgi:hypothetical protein